MGGGQVCRDGDETKGFLDRSDRIEAVTVRDRSSVRSQSLPRVDMLPPPEVKDAILRAVERNVGIGLADCAREVARMFGARYASEEMRLAVELRADELVREGRLVLSGDLRLPRERSDHGLTGRR